MNQRILEGLNPEQKMAVLHEGGPLLIFAGAGSGKTRVIVHRVANLIIQGVRPSEILCLTFTNKAAAEMKHRLNIIVGDDGSNVWAGTFHAFGARFLRHEAYLIGYPRSFVIYDEADQRSLIAKCIKELGINYERGMDAKVAWLYNMSRDTMRKIDDIEIDLFFDPKDVIARYEQRKKEFGVFDFGDLLSVPCRMLSTMPELREKYQAIYRHILVDEYQDTNTAQYSLLVQLIGTHRNICVVGDDDQSIYGWRGADVGNILRFKDDFAGANVITLEQNYRSSQGILSAASSLITNNQYRAPKKLRSTKGKGKDIGIVEFSDDEKEALNVAYTITNLISSGVSPLDIGVFYRVNALSRVIEEAFVRRRIPYAVYGGMRFYERREIKDLLAYLRIIANPADEEALSRIINTPPRGIGAKTHAALVAFARESKVPTMEALESALAQNIVKGAGRKGVDGFISLMRDIRSYAVNSDIPDLLAFIMDAAGLAQALAAEIDGEDRLTNVKELIASAAGHKDLTRYLEEKALMTSMDVESGDKVSVMTLHMSKGLEFDYVFILGLEEGILPHSRSMDTMLEIEEERRLLYVGITRARKQVMLSWARTRTLYGREVYQIPSGFLSEIKPC
ncbi:MAG: UvrD-helicase domain-containing protein [Deltaproteobacteria bacterium]|nr:UvrD-helicase domain-containing protein [Deltaproteobacteria bacterium]